nr:multiprotein bridging factor [Tanacetum cinerariifolium]
SGYALTVSAAQRAGTALDTSAKDRAQTKGRKVGKALAQARAAKTKPDGKSMTQKDLATAVNAKPQDVSRAVPNQALLGKIERIVGVKLRGAPALIGTPLGGPKKK